MLKVKISTTRMIELSLVFFITLLSFTIGTYVGKKYSDNQHRLAALDPHVAEKMNAQNEDASHATETTADHKDASSHQDIVEHKIPQPNAISDEDVAKMAEELNSEDNEQTVENETNEKMVEVVEDSKSNSIKKAVIEKTADKKMTAETLNREVASISKKAQAIVNQPEHNQTGSQYTIQVGSFPNTDEAEKVSESLKARGYRASQVKAEVNGKIWYRVQVGLFDNITDAQNYKKELMEKNRLTSAIIQKINQ